MRSRSFFFLSLTAFLLMYFVYGLHRFSLGIDFTDEGAYVAWPLRFLFGEKAFSSELTTLLRPLEVYFALPFRLCPTITLYEIRVLGWCFHLIAFSTLSYYLFRLRSAPLQSLLISSIPFFVCHIFGLAPIAYNTLSSDCLILALSFKGISDLASNKWKLPLEVGAGLALFTTTFAHPGLGLVAVCILGYEIICRELLPNLRQRQLSPSNVGILVFIACWGLFLVYVSLSGALSTWLERIGFIGSASAKALQGGSVLFFLRLLFYPFSYSTMGFMFALVMMALAIALPIFSRTGRREHAGRTAALLVAVFLAALVCTFNYESSRIPICFALISIVAVATLCFGALHSGFNASPSVRFLLLMSIIGTICYTTLTYYFSPYRSWISGILALPFAFSVGLTLLLKMNAVRLDPFRLMVGALLFIAVPCVIREHYWNIYRELPPPALQAYFDIPKLRNIRSTEERVRAVEDLYVYLQPKILRGEPLLVFDDCPMLYYLFDAMPAYGLTWATRFGLNTTLLEQLNRELVEKQLPNYTVRTLVNVSEPIWGTAPRTNYDHYPLNETVMANYELEKTIFPFEIWRLRSVPAP